MNKSYKEYYKRRLVESILNDSKNLNEDWWRRFFGSTPTPHSTPSRRPGTPYTPGPGGTLDIDPTDPDTWPGIDDLPSNIAAPIRKRFPDSYGPGGENRVFRPLNGGRGWQFRVGKKEYLITPNGRIYDLPPGFRVPALGAPIAPGLLGYDGNGNPVYADPGTGAPTTVAPADTPEGLPPFGREYPYDPYYNPAGENVNDPNL